LSGVQSGQVYAEDDTYTISGYVEPDFKLDNSDLKSGFLVELVGSGKSVLLDSTGYFEIKDVPSDPSGYTVKISKDNYLYRLIKDVEVTSNIKIGSKSNPVKMWAGDIFIKGVQDNAINVSDVIQIALSFNSISGDENYNEDIDINKNGAINMEDVIIVVRHFNMTPSDYPNVSVTKDYDTKFMFKIKTTQNGQRYKFPVSSTSDDYNIVVDWGDGTTSEIVKSNDIYHNYEIPGTYTIKVVSFTYFPISFKGDNMLIEVLTPIPDIGITTFKEFFSDCESLEKLPEGLFSNNINATDFYKCFYRCNSLTEIPDGLFDFNVNATNFEACFNTCSNIKKIPKGLFDNNENVVSFSECFYGCRNLEKIPDGLFNNNTNVTTFSYCFAYCSSLSEIPAGLFNNNVNVIDFSSCFRSCSNIEKIPDRLFDNNINATTFSYCFSSCSSLTEIPDGLFDNNVNAVDFSSCFRNCINIKKIPDKLFDNNINATTFSYCFSSCSSLTEIPDGLFNNNVKAVNFSNCFFNCIKLEGLAPALWLRTNVEKYSSCFYGCNKLSNYNDIPNGWK